MSQDDNRALKNSVFTAQQDIEQRLPTKTIAESVMSDFGLDIPLESVPLVSLGKVYPVGSPLHMQETVDIRAMTTREEDILSSRAYIKKGTVVTELIKSCMVNKSVNPSELIIGDRNALMVAIRITGYGSEYEAEVECSECDVKHTNVFDLSSLPVKHLEIDPIAPGQNEFSFVLPYLKKEVRFKFLTGRDEEEIIATSEKLKKHGLASENTVTTNLLYTLTSVAGVTDKNKISQFIKMMPARDSLALRTFIRDNEPGIDMKQTVTCPACGHSEEVSMPVTVGFLWPGRSS
jgi:hypothetical protein